MRLVDHLVHQVGYQGNQVVVVDNLGLVGDIVGFLGIHTVVVCLYKHHWDLIIENVT